MTDDKPEPASPMGARVDPHRIERPMQLLAAMAATLVLVDGALLAAASTIRNPSWVPGLLAMSAVLNVPLVLASLVLLLTRFRPELLTDRLYATYRREERESRTRTAQLELELQDHGLDTLAVGAGRSLDDLPADSRDRIRHLTSILEQAVRRIEALTPPATDLTPAPTAFLTLAKAFMAQRDWEQAAHYFDAYTERQPDDWLAQLSRGVAHANSGHGTASNRAALRAYSEAIAAAPSDRDPRALARAAVNRGATFRRLGRLVEAEADMFLAESLTRDAAIRGDVLYNRACLFAMTGRTEEAIAAARGLRGLPQAAALRAHLDDYFVDLRDDRRFLEALPDVSKPPATAPQEDWEE